MYKSLKLREPKTVEEIIIESMENAAQILIVTDLPGIYIKNYFIIE